MSAPHTATPLPPPAPPEEVDARIGLALFCKAQVIGATNSLKAKSLVPASLSQN
jgi:hypothetical protein